MIYIIKEQQKKKKWDLKVFLIYHMSQQHFDTELGVFSLKQIVFCISLRLTDEFKISR